MKNTPRYALDRLFFVFLLLGLAFANAAVVLMGEHEPVATAVCGVVALLFLLLPMIMIPWGYRFDRDGVTICYLLVPGQRFLWNRISAISVELESIVGASASSWISLFFPVFHLDGICEGNERFYMEGNIRKSRRTKRLLEEHWDGEIEGLFWRDVKRWFTKRKKAAEEAPRDTTEIAAMEQQLRQTVKEILTPVKEKLEQAGLTCKPSFFYQTDRKESHSRPKDNYTYLARIKIARLEKTDQDCKVLMDLELLYGRRGKTAYRGVPATDLQEQFQYLVEEPAREILLMGLDAYWEEYEA